MTGVRWVDTRGMTKAGEQYIHVLYLGKLELGLPWRVSCMNNRVIPSMTKWILFIFASRSPIDGLHEDGCYMIESS